MLISVKIKNSHAAYKDHSNNITTQTTVWEIGKDEIL